jgi:hypothetical protein
MAGPPAQWDNFKWDQSSWWLPLAAGQWDKSTWDQARWWAPLAGWGDDWRFWYQTQNRQEKELTNLVVEARWTTDSHAMGDGTFRGDLQPGKCAIRMWDPGRVVEGLNKQGAVWATYRPTGATWCWFYDSIDRALVAPGDPMGSDVVWSGLPWSSRMTSVYNNTYRGVESVNARINAMADLMAGGVDWVLPPVSRSIAGQSQLVSAQTIDTSVPAGMYPSLLQTLRNAGANGVVWLSAAMDGSGMGNLTLHYDRWETVNAARPLDGSQVIAGPPVETSVGWVINLVGFTATKGDTGVQSSQNTNAGGLGYGGYGVQYLGSMRLWGDISTSAAPEWSGQYGTAVSINNSRSNVSDASLSTITVQSGKRWTATGAPSAKQWDPAAHVWTPLDQLSYLDPRDNKTHLYRVKHSDHVLNATVWQTVHSLETYAAGSQLPA